jgi:hypothetical protein
MPARAKWALALAYLALWMGYALAGTPLVPLHGDESTLIYTTRDYFDQFVRGDLAQVTNRATDLDPMDANLRLLDGRVQKYLGGLAYHLSGGTADGLNQPWDWGGDVAYNAQAGRAPTPAVLMPNRWAMAALLALCVPAAFGVGMAVGGWPAALALPALLMLSPNLLLNGRRAMMEAPLMLFSLLTVLSGLRWAAAGRGGRGGWTALLALSAGLALASKHSGALVIAPVFGALGVLALARRDGRALLALMGAAIGALGVFGALNPAWWPDPLGAASTVLRLRSELLAGQTAFFGGYPDFGAQMGGFWRQTFGGAPQYYEVAAWADYIAADIAAYAASPWGGVTWGDFGGIVLALLALLGCAALLIRRDAAAWVFGVYAAGALLAALLFTPLEWARYYLVGLPAVYGLAAAGLSAIGRVLRPAGTAAR